MGTVALIRWLFVCLMISVLTKPVFDFKGLRLGDGGFSISLGIGTAVSFLTVFWVCVFTGCSFDTFSCVTILLAVSVVFCIIRYGNRNACRCKPAYPDINTRKDKGYIREKRLRFFAGFCFFSVLMFIAFWIKGYKPLIDFQTEQYMDYGFMNAIYRQKKLPFEDMWCAGRKVNYYYLGQAAAVYLCRLSGVTPEYGYNLMLCTLFASLVMTVFTLVEAFLGSGLNMGRAGSYTGGAAASLMCACGGNGHYIVYGIIRELYYRIRGIDTESHYWFPKSTMFIGFEADAIDKGKHEFPSYTLILGDLHAHACNMMFTIPLLAVLFDYALNPRRVDDTLMSDTPGADKKDSTKLKVSINKSLSDIAGEVSASHMILTGVLLGLFKGVNYWDFLIYYVVSGAVILAADLKRYGTGIGTVLKVLLKGLFILAVSCIVMLPFSTGYDRPEYGIYFADYYSPPDRFFIIWFAHIAMSVTLLAYIAVRHKRRETGHRDTHDQVMAAVTLCGLGLLLLPEIIYVKDIYPEAYQRFNTMFKLTYQAFILLSISSGMCTGILLDRGIDALKDKKRIGLPAMSVSITFCILVLMLASYSGPAVKQWFGNVFVPGNRKSISATEFIENDTIFNNAREAIDILNDDGRNLRILEESGTSYKPENKLSVFTGASTVMGWNVHEWLWRNDKEMVSERNREVNCFYSCGLKDYCRAFLDAYDVDYIYVGPKVLEKYDVDYKGFASLGEHVWESPDRRFMLIKVYKDRE